MKIIVVFIAIVLILYSCNAKNRETTGVSNIDYELTAEQKMKLASAFAYADSVRVTTRSANDFYAKFASEKGKEILYLPVYRCDVDKFYGNPTAENFLASLYKEEFEWFITKGEPSVVNAICIGQEKERWLPRGITYDVKEGYEWLEKPYADWKSTDFRIIHFEGLVFFTYLSEGKRVYRNNMGYVLTPEQLCEYLWGLLKGWKEHAERGDTVFA